MLERTIENYLRTEIRKLGGEMEKFVSPGVRGRPDDIVDWPAYSKGWRNAGAFIAAGSLAAPVVEFIEAKTKGGRLSVLQKRDHTRRRAKGFLVHVIWTMAQAEDYLHSRGKKADLL